MSGPADLAERRRWRSAPLKAISAGRLVEALLLAAWFAILMLLFTRANGFPRFWHWDEPGKVDQILTGQYNFRHPQLLLTLTRLALWVSGATPSPQTVVVIGRGVSAAAMAAAVILMTLLARRLAGRRAALLAALMVGSNPLIFALAHYMKEDAVFLLGLAAFLLAFVAYSERPGTARLCAMGLAAGLAVSGKYLGIIALPLGLGLAAWTHRTAPTRGVGAGVLLLASALAVFAAIDLPMLTTTAPLADIVAGQARHVLTNQHGLVYPPWAGIYLSGLIAAGTPVTLLGYALWLFWCWPRRRTLPAGFLVVTLFPLAFLAMLQLAPVKLIRYELPVVALAGMAAACGLALPAGRARAAPLRLLAYGGVAVVLVLDAGAIAGHLAAIRADSRLAMAQWIRENLPAGAVLAEEATAGMVSRDREPGDPCALAMTVIPAQWGETFQSVAALRAQGVRYLLIGRTHEMFFDPAQRLDDDPAAAAEAVAAREFYRVLLHTVAPIRRIEGADTIDHVFSPTLLLFDLDAPE